jgi:NAD(P)H-dependent flavin oxidoreductase YrpB (nitropropane dioxygenase family)
MPSETFTNDLTRQLGILHPVMLAGMNVAAGPELAAAVTNAGGLGVIGGVGYTPKFLREQIAVLKEHLTNKDAPFGVDLLLPQVGGSARKTNTDYTNGTLPELIDVIISEGAKLFVSAVGVPPKFAVDKLHAAGIPVMNMIGHPKHVSKALAAGCDMICAQGGEGGGHTGSVPTSILIPKVVDECRGHKSPLTGNRIFVVAAGGIYDSRGLASALSMGADAVWVGTRFICATEAGAPPRHQKGVITANYDDTVRTIIYTGRPMRVKKTPYIMDWEDNRQDEIKALVSKGVLPFSNELSERSKAGNDLSVKEMAEARPMLMGQCAAAVTEIIPAKDIIEEMVSGAVAHIKAVNSRISAVARL